MPISKTLISALAGGASASVIAPVLWPVVLLFEKDLFWGSSDLATLLSGLLAVGGIALVGGLVLGALVGFPILLLFQKLRLKNPILIVLTGAFTSSIIFSHWLSWPIEAWPLYAFFFIVGGLCSAVATILLHSNFHLTRSPSATGEFPR